MKKINSHICWSFYFFLLLVGGGACTSYLENEPNVIVEGQPAKISLGLDVFENRVVSRSSDKKSIRNIYVFVFNSAGEKEAGEFFESNTNNQYTINTLSGSDKTIYAVANIDLAIMNTTTDMLDTINTFGALQELNADLTQLTLARGANVLMSGMVSDDASGVLAKKINISPTAGENTEPVGNISLRRLDAKVTFKIKVENTPATPDPITNIVFNATGWRLKNGSKSAYLLYRDRNSAASDIFETDWANLDGVTEQDTLLNNTFTFYSLENRRNHKKIIPTENNTDLTAQRYALRGKRSKGDDGKYTEPHSFEYANDSSTYIQIRGDIKYNKGTTIVTANVVYSIHLGYANNDPNDYNTNRNTHYTYNITIKSVNDIITEARSDSLGIEPDPGADGEVTISFKNYLFDAHYDAKVVTFNKQIMGGKFQWSANTAFGSGSHDPANPDNPLPNDYKWLYFRLNSNNGIYSNNLVAYPGKDRVYIVNDSNILADYRDNGTDKLVDIHNLVKILNALPNTDESDLFDELGDIKFTAFINENYYENHPTEHISVTDNQPLWKKFVNTETNRSLRILTSEANSLDGSSSVVESTISFTQKSIQTMYNIDIAVDNLLAAWGAESDDEDTDGRLQFTHPSNNVLTTPINHDGLLNTKTLWGIPSSPLKEWRTFVNPDSNLMLDEYKYARYACMTRNRDLNGDGYIDDGEIRWYLASINQLTDLWIGENSFRKEAHLYKNSGKNDVETSTDWGEELYLTSTITFNRDNNMNKHQPRVLWSSEGSSVGHVGAEANKKLSFRCLRNLGDIIPQNIATYDSTTRIMSLEFLDSRSIRRYSTITELPQHNERDPENLPWRSFEIAVANVLLPNSNLHMSGTWKYYNDLLLAGDSPCPNRWRMPNQRELALIQSRVPKNNLLNPIIGSTAFSLSPTASSKGSRPGFAIIGGGNILKLLTSNEWGGVRCVRDI